MAFLQNETIHTMKEVIVQRVARQMLIEGDPRELYQGKGRLSIIALGIVQGNVYELVNPTNTVEIQPNLDKVIGYAADASGEYTKHITVAEIVSAMGGLAEAVWRGDLNL